MQLEVEVNGRPRQVTITRSNGRFIVATGGREWAVDASLVGSHLLSLLMEDVQPASGTPGEQTGTAMTGLATCSREISIATDPLGGQFVFAIGGIPLVVGLNNSRRRRGRPDDRHGSSAAPQRIVAPMPGKIVRVLGKPGEAVVLRQPVVVIEAMKMENELRALRDGTLTEILVKPGQSVEAGTLLAIITPS